MAPIAVPFALPDLGQEELEGIRRVLDSGWITTGKKTREFEEQFAARIGVRQAVAVNSCTAAMHLALDAVGLERGDEVITSPYTFAATGEVIRYFGAKPVFVDIDPQSLNLAVDGLEAAVTPKTKVILPVHVAGLPAEMDEILSLADRHGLRVVEDAAHAFPASYKGRPVGSLGDITCFSFYASKTITTGEGGMICTNSSDWSERCRLMSLHGLSKDAWSRSSDREPWYYEIIAPGFKYNLTDIAAAIGLAQLRKAEWMWRRREEIAERYTRAFQELRELQVPHDRRDCEHAWHLYSLRLNLTLLRIDRNGFISALRDRGINTSVHFIPLHVHPYYRKTFGYQQEDFPVAYREYLREVSLPIYSKMSDRQVNYVIACIREIVEQNGC